MDQDKIRISWEEVQSPGVDAQIKQQAALAHAQEHLQTQQRPALIAPNRGGVSALYNAILYLSFFGLVGGVLAWGFGELVFLTIHSNLDELTKFIEKENRIIANQKGGQLTQEAANQALKQLDNEYRSNPYVANQLDTTINDLEKNVRAEQQVEKDRRKEFMRNAVWFAFLGTIIALFLAVAEPVVSRNIHGVIVHGTVGALLGLVGGLLVSTFIDSLYRALQGGQNQGLGTQIFARTIGWGVLGLFLAIGPGIVLRNVKRMAIGVGGGLAGGLLGGLLFDPIAMATQNVYLSRFVAIAAIGTFAGLGTGILENVAKTGWVRVTAGLIAGKQFILYRNPTTIGSSPQCEIYLFKDTQVLPRHALIHLIPGGFELEDLQSITGTFVNGHPVSRTRLRTGDHIQVGSTSFSFQEKAKAS